MFATVIRDRIEKKLRYYYGHNDDREELPEVSGDVLRVYTGHYMSVQMFHPQVVLANELPGPGPHDETFVLAFMGPREEAIEIFWAHVGMLP